MELYTELDDIRVIDKDGRNVFSAESVETISPTAPGFISVKYGDYMGETYMMMPGDRASITGVTVHTLFERGDSVKFGDEEDGYSTGTVDEAYYLNDKIMYRVQTYNHLGFPSRIERLTEDELDIFKDDQ